MPPQSCLTSSTVYFARLRSSVGLISSCCDIFSSILRVRIWLFGWLSLGLQGSTKPYVDEDVVTIEGAYGLSGRPRVLDIKFDGVRSQFFVEFPGYVFSEKSEPAR